MNTVTSFAALLGIGIFLSTTALADNDFDDIFGDDGSVSERALKKKKGKAAEDDPEKYGKLATAFGMTISGVPVYYGKIKRKYKVIGKIIEKRRQISGPMYYDNFSGAAWMAHRGSAKGADAIIEYGSRRIPGKSFFFDPGYFEAWGTAVKYLK